MCSPLASFAGEHGEKIDLTDRSFCGYKCPDDSTFRQATLRDEAELKKEAWRKRKIADPGIGLNHHLSPDEKQRPPEIRGPVG